MMGRKANPAAQLVEDFPVAEVAEAQNQLAVLTAEQDAQVREIAARLGYQLPADCTDPDLIQRDIAANMRRSVEACLEIGRGLQVLKAACRHGEFIHRLDSLGLDRKVAVKFMSASAKFATLGSDSALIKALGNQSKLFEMLVLDDEEIQELELTGQTGELTLDDVSAMSMRELRAKLREARETLSAKERVMADKDRKINELAEQLARKPVVEVKTADEQLAELRQEGDVRASAVEAAIAGQLHPAINALLQHADETGADQRVVVAGWLAQIERAVAAIRVEYGIDTMPATTPSWMSEEADQVVLERLAQEQGV